jgi:hypothetical protein
VGAQADLSAAEAVAALLGQEVVGVAPLGGAYRIRLADGTTSAMSSGARSRRR